MKSNEKVHVYKSFSTVDSLIIVIYATLFILGGAFFLVYTMGYYFQWHLGAGLYICWECFYFTKKRILSSDTISSYGCQE